MNTRQEKDWKYLLVTIRRMRNVCIKNLEAAMTHFTLSLENGFPSVVSSSSFTLYITQGYGWKYSISQIQVKCTDHSFQAENIKLQFWKVQLRKQLLFFFCRNICRCSWDHCPVAWPHIWLQKMRFLLCTNHCMICVASVGGASLWCLSVHSF